MLSREDTKHLVALVTALAGLATAVKSCSDSAAQAELVATRKVYAVVAARIANQDEQIQKLHDDDVALRSYVEGFKEAVSRAVPPPSPPAAPAARPHPPAPVRLVRESYSATPADTGSTETPLQDEMPTEVQVLPPPPAPKAAPRFEKLPSFDNIR